MKKIGLWCVVFAVMIFTTVFSQARISPRLEQALYEAQLENSTVRAYVVLKNQVDILALDRQIYSENASTKERAYRVITRLQNKADNTQGPVQQFLTSKSAEEVNEVQSFWITNMLLVEALPVVFYELSTRQDIDFMDLAGQIVLDKPVEKGPVTKSIQNNAEPGLRAIKAHLMWRMGFTGQGRLVMNIDSGVNGNHRALSDRWRGNHVPSNHAWYGAGTFPSDCDNLNNHGTHTMGTMAGRDPITFDTIGVAPDAEWIAAGTVGCGGSTVGAFQWALNPDGDPNTIVDMPDAIGNSWRDPGGGDCASNIYQSSINALEAAGVAVVFSAGNSGPGSSSITPPKNTNVNLVNIWATGAVNGHNPSFPIASFSSRGPSTCGGTGSLLIKPEACAPGVSVRSSQFNNQYGTLSGTSMACPHVVGAIALLKQAFPQFTGHQLKLALYNSAQDLGASGEDNTYGMGIIDVYAAFQSLGVPNPPTNFTSYSDYTMPNSIQLSWTDPTNLANGDTLLPDTFSVHIGRDSLLIDSVDAGVENYLDTGLTDGQEYSYQIFAKLDSSDLQSLVVESSWIAGGSPIPSKPNNFSVAGGQNEITVSWVNPAENIDGTPMDDFGGINLYRNGQLAVTFNRTSADTGLADTVVHSISVPGFYDWYITAFDDENPPNESDSTMILGTPISVPVTDQFVDPGEPNPGLWINAHSDINDRSMNPPSAPYALNLNGTPAGGDTVDMNPLDLSGLEGTGIKFSFYYQPEGNGNAPEPADSLLLYFKNDLNEWVLVRGYEGASVQPFQQEQIEIETAPNGGGSYFHGQFSVRFRSIGGSANIPNDDWFVDDIVLDFPVGLPDQANLSQQYAVSPNYPNPFNPTTTIRYQLPERHQVTLMIYNLLGQRVRTLLNQTMAAGTHQVIWKGRNDQGEPVSSGIYVYRFRAGDFQKSQKMILLK